VDPGPKEWGIEDHILRCGADKHEGEWTFRIDSNEVRKHLAEDIKIEYMAIHIAIFNDIYLAW
jgi:hypothetical protein